MMARSWLGWTLTLAAGCSSSLSVYDAGKAPPPDDETTTAPTVDTSTSGPVDTATTPTTTPVDDAKRPDLDLVEPWFGTVGQVVTITGGPFADPLEVTFDGVDAHVVDFTEDSVDVQVPDLGDDVDAAVIEIRSADKKGKNELTFRYFMDGNGLVGAVGTLEWDDLRGGYWDPYDPNSVDHGYGQVLLSIPSATTWQTWLFSPVVEHCELDYSTVDPLYVYDPGLSSLTLTSGASVITLPGDAVNPFVFWQSNLLVTPGAAYDLAPTAGNPAWPEFSVPGMSGQVPTGLTITSPSLDGSTPARTSRQFTVQWDGPFGDGVLLYLERQRGGATQEVVTCWVQDDGSFALPNLWTDWQTDDGVLFYAGRYNEPSNVLLPYNNARSNVLGIFWTVGYLLAN